MTTQLPPTSVQPTQPQRICLDCEKPFPHTFLRLRCDTCQDQRDAALQQAERQSLNQLVARRWKDTLSRYESQAFSRFQEFYLFVEPETKRAVEDWITQDLPGLHRGLGIIGPVGSGKTTSAVQALYHAIRHGYTVAITSDPRINTLVATSNAGTDHNKATAIQELRDLEKADVLLIDDLGHSCKGNNLAQRELFRLIHTRFQASRINIWTAQGGTNWLALQWGGTPEGKDTVIPTEEAAMVIRRLTFRGFMRLTRTTTAITAAPLS